MVRESFFEQPAIVRPANAALAELAARANAEHAEALSAARASIAHARNAGQLLMEAKKQCDHGQWQPWLQANVKFSERTARVYMQVACRWDELESKRQATAVLTIEDGLKLLAAPSDGDANLPELHPNFGYVCDGHHAESGMSCLAEIDPHPDHPGYWAYAFHFWRPGDESAECCYCGRGIRLDPDTVKRTMARMQFIPDGSWLQTEPEPLPLAVQYYREDFKLTLKRSA